MFQEGARERCKVTVSCFLYSLAASGNLFWWDILRQFILVGMLKEKYSAEN